MEGGGFQRPSEGNLGSVSHTIKSQSPAVMTASEPPLRPAFPGDAPPLTRNNAALHRARTVLVVFDADS